MTPVTSVSPSVGELNTTSIGARGTGGALGSSDATTCGAFERDTRVAFKLTRPFSRTTVPVTSSQRSVSTLPIDVEVESLSARPHVGDPKRTFSAAKDEVVLALAGCARQVAKQIASAKIAGDGDCLPVVSPRFDRDRFDRRTCDCLRLRSPADAYDQLFARFWPLIRVATVIEASSARIARLETSNVQEEAACIDDAVRRIDTIVEEHAHFVFVGTEKHLRAFGRELAAYEHVLQVIEAGILPECVDRGQTTDVRLGIRDGDQKKG